MTNSKQKDGGPAFPIKEMKILEGDLSTAGANLKVKNEIYHGLTKFEYLVAHAPICPLSFMIELSPEQNEIPMDMREEWKEWQMDREIKWPIWWATKILEEMEKRK